jgi:hypothetical protein
MALSLRADEQRLYCVIEAVANNRDLPCLAPRRVRVNRTAGDGVTPRICRVRGIRFPGVAYGP